MTKKKSHSSNTIRRGTWGAIAFFMLGLAVVAGFYFEQNTRITAVEYSGHTFTTSESLEESMNSPIGMLADSVDYNAIYSSLRELPYVKDVAVRMSFRGTLTVEITERQPIALLVVSPISILTEKEFSCHFCPESGLMFRLCMGSGQQHPAILSRALNLRM